MLDWHIGRSVLGGILLVLITFASLVSLFTLVDELSEDDVGYNALLALKYVGLTLPRRVYEMLPYAAFIGALMGLGQLANHSELLVMRSSGYSTARIFAAVCVPAALLLLLGYLIGEYLAPAAEERASELKAKAAQASDTVYIDGGHWYREGGLFVNIDGIKDRVTLRGIVLYELAADGRVLNIKRAATADYAPSGAQHIWLLRDVAETRFEVRAGQPAKAAQTLHYEEFAWHSSADPRLLSARALLEPRRMSLNDLFYQVDYMRREGLRPTRYQLALWGKLLQPFAVIGLCLLALSFILGPLRQRGIGVRLSVGVVVGLLFKYLQDLFGPLSMVYGMPAWLGVLLPIALCWLLGIIGFRRIG
jgi:lipopolysaccharide export system permease protein